jgi:hypothetical protein
MFAAVFVLLNSPAVQAQSEQQPPGLFERVYTADAITRAGRGPIKRSESVAVKLGLLGNLKQPAQTITLNLIDDTTPADDWHIDDVLIQACVPFMGVLTFADFRRCVTSYAPYGKRARMYL